MHRSDHIAARRRTALALATVGMLVLAGCGDDEDGTAATTAPAVTTAASESTAAPATTQAPATTAAPATTGAPAATTVAPETTATAAETTVVEASFDAWCQAELAVEAAVSSPDGSADVPGAFAALAAAAPSEAQDVTSRTIAAAQAMMEAGGMPTPEFDEAYAQLMAMMADNCDFGAMTVVATNYAFEGIPETMSAGPVIITIQNDGNEFHEVMLFRKNDGVTENAAEILSLPEDEAMALVQHIGGAFTAPGTTGYGVADLVPGDYIAICMIPEGTTQEAYDEAMTTGSFPEGMPHAMKGMVATFTVS